MDNLLNSTFKNRQLTLLQIDRITLGFAHDQILTIESISDINSQRPSKKSSGTLLYNTRKLNIYTFNHDLRLLDKPTSNNRICIAIKHSNNTESFALMCDAVEQYILDDDASISAIPPLLSNPDSPIIGMLNKDTKLVLLASAESIRSYVNSQEAHYA